MKISQVIDSFYNESFRSLISALVVRLLERSNRNEAQLQIEVARIGQIVKLVKQGSQEIKDDEGNPITK